MKIGVIGASGRLGTTMMRTLDRLEGVESIALEAPTVGVDAVINAAPLRDAVLHHPQRDGGSLSVRRLFDLDSPEFEFLDEAARIRFVTGFDSRSMNAFIYALGFVRRAAPSMYARLRDGIARRKARADEATIEVIELGALALNRHGTVLASRLLRLASDYRTLPLERTSDQTPC